MSEKRYSLGRNSYKQKPNDNKFIAAAKKIQKHLQEEENRKYGKKAQEVSYYYVTRYIYENYMKGRRIK